MPFQKIILVLADDCNSSRQVAFSDLGQAKQVFRGISPTRNHDVGDFLLKSNSRNLPITHVGTCFLTLWINHSGPVVLWCHKPRVVFYAEDSDQRLGEGVWPERWRSRNVGLFWGIGAEEGCTVPPSPLHYDF